MRICSRNRRRLGRSGVVMAEAAIVLPTLFVFLIGTITIGRGIFLYQQVAELAREGNRQAIVHGSTYASDNNTTAWGSTQITNAITPLAVGLNTADITVTANPTTVGAQGTKMQVTVSYSWTPEKYIVGPITLSSKSEMLVAY